MMDEAGAKAWLRDALDVSRETLERLEAYVALLLAESERQNLIARSTFDSVWNRHIVDSAQLSLFADTSGTSRRWLDIGSGPGLPGLVLAILGCQVTLVESRSRRVAFLHEAAETLDLQANVSIEGKRLETVETVRHDIVTARAFAPMAKTFDLAARFLGKGGMWILPRGKSVEAELAAARDSWQGDFQTVQSVTSSEAFIVVARNVRRRK